MVQRLRGRSIGLLHHEDREELPALDARRGFQDLAAHWARRSAYLIRRPGSHAKGSEDVAATEGDWYFGAGSVGELLHADGAVFVFFGEVDYSYFWERVQESRH